MEVILINQLLLLGIINASKIYTVPAPTKASLVELPGGVRDDGKVIPVTDSTNDSAREEKKSHNVNQTIALESKYITPLIRVHMLGFGFQHNPNPAKKKKS